MYKWRKMTPEQRKETLESRKSFGRPWHGPPHHMSNNALYHVTAACYEHNLIIGQSPERMAEFESELIKNATIHGEKVLAWCVLPNHYHLQIDSECVLDTIREIGLLHGRTSYGWNKGDHMRGRKCWHRCVEREMRSERHKWVTLNYIHHNPVHHGYVKRWQHWTFSSAARYLEEVGYTTALERWKAYPLLDYGKGWDDPEL